MRVIIHDLGKEYDEFLKKKCDCLIRADGKFAPCQGCFNCWTKHPAKCVMGDGLQEVCRIVGRADELIIISENCYGSYSPKVKNILDRSIGISTPLSTYRGRQMHHKLRYSWHRFIRVIAYGEMTEDEKETFSLLAERNALNLGFENSQFTYIDNIDNLESCV